MKDKGIDLGLIVSVDTSKRSKRGYSKGVWLFRKMFWDYLNKLGVAFYDTCCSDASTADTYPVRYNSTLQRLEYYNGEWLDITGISETTTTTTTAAP